MAEPVSAALIARHTFVQEWSGESPYCGEPVMRNGGGDTCGERRDHPAHAPSDGACDGERAR